MGNTILALASVASGLLATACLSDPQGQTRAEVKATSNLKQTNLVADVDGVARHTDPKLVNAWGVVMDDDGLFWIADNGTGSISIVDKNGAPSTEDYVSDQFDLGEGITGIVVNDDPAIDVELLVASEAGTIQGINDEINKTGGVPFADESGAGASYKGLAIVDNDGISTVLAANFASGTLDMFDTKGKRVTASGFTDPDLKPGFVPFNVVAIDGRVFVSYAFKANPTDDDETAGAGLGAIDEYAPNGKLVAQLASGGDLNAPWGMTKMGTSLIVGNFGDGHLTELDLSSGKELGQLTCDAGETVVIDGLWGLTAVGDKLYVAAGPADESHGLFARLAQRTAH